jgi:hypothetical protein
MRGEIGSWRDENRELQAALAQANQVIAQQMRLLDEKV